MGTLATCSVPLYRLQLVPGDPQSYLVDGKAEPMGRQQVEVVLRDGTVVRPDLPTSRYGPVLAAGRSEKYAYALADANAANLRAADEWLAMGRARNLTELRKAQDTHQGMAFVHTLATDTGGTAYFADASVVPNVSDALAALCAKPSPSPEVDSPVLDGSTTACLWGKVGDAVLRRSTLIIRSPRRAGSSATPPRCGRWPTRWTSSGPTASP